MSGWDAAAETMGPPSRRGQRERGGGLNQPLLDGEPKASIANDEITHGSGKGLTLLYEATTEEDHERIMAEEREREIERTHEQVVLVNEVFNDLGQLVATQQADVDTIEHQVETAHERTQAGTKQLENAVKNQRSVNRWGLYPSLCVAFVAPMLIDARLRDPATPRTHAFLHPLAHGWVQLLHHHPRLTTAPLSHPRCCYFLE